MHTIFSYPKIHNRPKEFRLLTKILIVTIIGILIFFLGILGARSLFHLSDEPEFLSQVDGI